MTFTEANYENAIIQLFTGTLGCTHAYAPDIPRDYHTPLCEAVLTPALYCLGPLNQHLSAIITNERS